MSLVRAYRFRNITIEENIRRNLNRETERKFLEDRVYVDMCESGHICVFDDNGMNCKGRTMSLLVRSRTAGHQVADRLVR